MSHSYRPGQDPVRDTGPIPRVPAQTQRADTGFLETRVVAAQDGKFTRIHKGVNRVLRTIALILSILVLLGLILTYFRIDNALANLSEAFGGATAASSTDLSPAPFDPTGDVQVPDPTDETDIGLDAEMLNTEYGTVPLGEPYPDGTVCQEVAEANAVLCDGPSADAIEEYFNGPND